MSVERVKQYLRSYQMAERIIYLEASSATVPLAAKALGTSEDQIAKTLSFLVDEQPILIVTAGTAKIQNGKYKKVFHTKAKMIPYDLVEDYIGHKAGGVCPFGINEGVAVYLDESLKRHETVFPACGSGHTAMEITIDELERVSQSLGWIDVTK